VTPARSTDEPAPGWAGLGSGALAGPYGAAIADAKGRWLQACSDGSSAARVQRLYDAYRDLVITQAAVVVHGQAAQAS
jgi:hypothetical protein